MPLFRNSRKAAAPARARRELARPRIESLEDRCLLSGDVVLHWNSVAIEAAKRDHAIGGPHEQLGPTRTSRALAIVHAAIFDAVNSIDRSYQPYLVDDVHASSGASIAAAAAQAGHDTLAALYPAMTAMFDAALTADLAGIAPGRARQGIEVGQYVASQILALRAHDGSDANPVYTPGTDPGQWRPDPLHPGQQHLGPAWGQVTPFVIQSGSQFRAPPPPAMNSPEYTAAFNEVKALGGDGLTTPSSRTEDETEIGIFWGYDGQPGLCAPPRLYNQIGEIIAQNQGNSEVQNARFFALINLAMADAAITVWETKYHYNFWRPVAAIREAATDGNADTAADPNWSPLGAPADNDNGTNFTPPFPAYTSGHAGIGAAMFHTVADFYGTDQIPFSFTSDEFNGVNLDQNGLPRPLRTRSYTSMSQAAEENGQSRIYLGIHWRFDKVQGIAQGNHIADYIFQHALQPRLHGNQAFVAHLYQDLLHRAVDPVGLSAFGTALDHGMSRTQVILLVEQSPEYRQVVVNDLYQSMLHRAPDATGLAGFTALLASGATVEQVKVQIASSNEYLQLRGGGNTAAFLEAAYQDLLHRSLDASGAATFSAALQAGISRNAVVNALIQSGECLATIVENAYETYLHRHSDAAGLSVFTQALQSGVRDDQLNAAFLNSDEYYQKSQR